MANDDLEQELEYFEKQKEELLKHHEGHFALIKGEKLVGTFTTEQEAYEAGVGRFGTEPFLIKRVVKDEDVTHFPALCLGLLHANS